MLKVKVTRKFQITIPLEIRKKMDVKIGDELIVKEEDGKIILTKPPSLKELAGAWEHIESTEDFMDDVRRMWKTWKLK